MADDEIAEVTRCKNVDILNPIGSRIRNRRRAHNPIGAIRQAEISPLHAPKVVMPVIHNQCVVVTLGESINGMTQGAIVEDDDRWAALNGKPLDRKQAR